MLTPKSKFGSFDLHYFLSKYIASSPSFLEHLISTYLHYTTSVQLDIVFLKQKKSCNIWTTITQGFFITISKSECKSYNGYLGTCPSADFGY